MAWKSSFRQNYRTTFSPTVPPSTARISCFVTTWRHLVAKVGTSKRGGKQWQTTPKNLPRMQHTRAIPVTWLSSDLCPDRPKGWIPIIIIVLKTVSTLQDDFELVMSKKVRRTFTRLLWNSSTVYVLCISHSWLCQSIKQHYVKQQHSGK